MRDSAFHYNPPAGNKLHILYEDLQILVISKPSGLLSVPGRAPEHHDSIAARALKITPEARIVHRLDMDTSGIMVLAKDAQTHKNLNLQFEKRRTQKRYIAHVWGNIKKGTGRIDLPLRCDWPNRPLQMVDHELGRNASTLWSVLKRAENHTRIALTPITGRSHQLRVHMKELGHPILGDRFYGTEDIQNAAPRLMLHAQSLTLHHPDDDREITFYDPCTF